MDFRRDENLSPCNQIDHAQVAVIAGAGHMAHVDEPDQWIAALERFLTQ
jgi:pimeloyl-ACP methyl ester carboxylesterase